jgi:tubulin-specific chaperone E
MDAHVGQRLVFEGHLCTVRYHGPLEGTSGGWLGVEWDDPARGKHNGTHKGHSIFSCLSGSPTAASFVRPTRKSDPTRTILEAIKHKYNQKSNSNGSLSGPGYEIIEISKKKVEEVGFDKIKQQMSHLENLKIVLVDQLSVVGLVRPGGDVISAQEDLAASCPNITELDLGWNPIQDWADILDIGECLQKLTVLKASGLRLRSMDPGKKNHSVTELHLNENLLRPVDVLRLLCYNSEPAFPNLNDLWLSQNDLSDFLMDGLNCQLTSVKTLVLENNLFKSLEDLRPVFKLFPNLTSLSLQGNRIARTGNIELISSALTTLNLSSNGIQDFSFIEPLPTLFPSLSSLRISRNPLYDRLAQAPPNTSTDTTPAPSVPSRRSDSPFYLTIARLPNLISLNYTAVKPRDREEGEIYYLAITEKEILTRLDPSPPRNENSPDATRLAALEPNYPLYATLCAKYDRPNIFTTPPSLSSPTAHANTPQFAATNTTLAARLINATFYTAPSTSQPTRTLTRLIPRTTPVNTLKSILATHFSLPHLRFRLVYESPELDPEVVTTTKLYGVSREEWAEWGRWDVDVRSPPLDGEGNADSGDGDGDGLGRWVEDGKVLLRAGARWRRREVEVLDGGRAWGDYLDGAEVREVSLRIELL